ncbi:MAG: DinB family protein, partial [Sciscionella sp.]|nr:DinB family protein [Sciscionella sp.]
RHMIDGGRGLITAFDNVWRRFTDRLAGLTDDEYFWEPVAECWTLRQRPNGRWRLDGAGGNAPTPDPPPVCTIAWRIGHLAGMNLRGHADRLFGDATLDAKRLDYPSTVAALPAFLAEHYGVWRDGTGALDADGWASPLGPNWGPYAESTVFDLALHVFDEVVHHAAEIGLLRDLYSRRAELIDRAD